MRVRAEDLSLEFSEGTAPLRVLEDISFDLRGSQIACIVGPSGCGKSSLLRMLAGLLEPTAGRLRLELAENPERLPAALVFQDHGIFPWLSVLDNVLIGLERSRLGRDDKRARALDFLSQFDIADFAHYYPHQISVGMRQRVALARAFVAEPQLLLMDEPFAALDALTKVILQEELLRIWAHHRSLVVYVTHDLTEAVLLGDRVFVLSSRPARVLEEIEIDLPRPRRGDQIEPGSLRRLETRLWNALEEDVRSGLASRPSSR